MDLEGRKCGPFLFIMGKTKEIDTFYKKLEGLSIVVANKIKESQALIAKYERLSIDQHNKLNEIYQQLRLNYDLISDSIEQMRQTISQDESLSPVLTILNTWENDLKKAVDLIESIKAK